MEEQFDDSSSDIGEGIVPQENVSLNEAFEEDSDTDTPDIFGESSGDEWDEDDEDFEEEDEDLIFLLDEEEVVQNKRTKMFERLQFKAMNDDDEEDQEEDEDDDDDDSEDRFAELVAKHLDKRALRAHFENAIVEDDDEADDDISSEDEDDKAIDNAITKVCILRAKNSMLKINNEEVVTKKKADEAPNKKDVSKENTIVEEPLILDLEKLVLIHNIPRGVPIDIIKYLFSRYGAIEYMNYPLSDSFQNIFKYRKYPNVETTVAATVAGHMQYVKKESALKAAKSLHGIKLMGNYLSVLNGHKYARPIPTAKTVFVDNLKQGIEENEIWKIFGKCGRIRYINLDRDFRSRLPKGSGSVTFDSKDAVHLALKLNGTKFMGQPLKVKPCMSPKEYDEYLDHRIKSIAKIKNLGTKQILSHKDYNKPSKKFKNKFKNSAEHERSVVKYTQQRDKGIEIWKDIWKGISVAFLTWSLWKIFTSLRKTLTK